MAYKMSASMRLSGEIARGTATAVLNNSNRDVRDSHHTRRLLLVRNDGVAPTTLFRIRQDMMLDYEEMQAGDQTVRYDRERTIEAYASIAHGDADECGCSHCRNFAAQRNTAYPSEFRRLLESLGIDVGKEGEVYECGGDESVRSYGGWFYFAGAVVEAGERLTEANDSFNYYFVDAKRLPKPQADFGSDIAAIEFYTKIPWLLAAERP